MTDLFGAYAAQAIPLAQQRKQAKAEKPKSQLDLKMEEKQRLSRTYRVMRRKLNLEILASEPRLGAFAKYLRTATDSDELVEAIRESWLPRATQDVKHYALKLVSARCDRLDREAGFAPLDDPMPPTPTAFFRAKEALGAR